MGRSSSAFVDPYVQEAVAGTNGRLYRSLIDPPDGGELVSERVRLAHAVEDRIPISIPEVGRRRS